MTQADALPRRSNLPMTLTLSRIIAGPVIAGLVLWGETLVFDDRARAALLFACAAALFIAAALTDWLDGYLARKLKAVTPLGAALDHCADKVLVTCALVALAFHSLPLNLVVAAILLLGRDVTISGLREGLAASGRTLPVSWMGKWKAAATMIGVAALLIEEAAFLYVAPDALYIAAAWTGRIMIWAAVSLALVSGWQYAADAVRKTA
ncbi:MAG: CDP-diacylglycerol--glycerol-3-phosphate 3-phosphatidyltransferase [Terricaulis sp.]